METGTQQIKHWDGLEFAKTNTWTFPDYVLASQGMWSHQSVLWVVAEDSYGVAPLPLAGLLKENPLLIAAWHLRCLREASAASFVSTNYSTGDESLYQQKSSSCS